MGATFFSKKKGYPCFLPLPFLVILVSHLKWWQRSVLFFPYIYTATDKNQEAQNIMYQPLGTGGLRLGGTELLLRCFLCKSSLAQQFYYALYVRHLSARGCAALRSTIYEMKELTQRDLSPLWVKHSPAKTRPASLLGTGSQQNYSSVDFANFEAPFSILLLFITCLGFKTVLTFSASPSTAEVLPIIWELYARVIVNE